MKIDDNGQTKKHHIIIWIGTKDDECKERLVMNKASVPFAEIKKELLSNPEVKEEYDKLEAEYKSINQMNQQDIDKELQTLIIELQTLRESEHKAEFEKKLARWHELKQQKIIAMLQPILLSIYGENIMEIISFEADDLSYINLALLLENHVRDTKNREMLQTEIEKIEERENLCGESITVWEIDWKSYMHHNSILYDNIRSGHTIYCRDQQIDTDNIKNCRSEGR